MQTRFRRVRGVQAFLTRTGACLLLISGVAAGSVFSAAAGPLDDIGESFAFVTGATGFVESGTDERLLAIAAVVIPEGESVADPGGESAGFILSAGGGAEISDGDDADDIEAVLESGDATFVDGDSDLTISAGSDTATIVRFAIVDDGESAPWEGDDDVIDLETISLPGSGENGKQSISLRFAHLTSGTQASIGDDDHLIPVVIPLAGSIELANGESVQQGSLAVNPASEADGSVAFSAPSDNAFVVVLVVGPDLRSGDDDDSDSPGDDPTPTPESNGGVIPGVGDDDPDPDQDPGDQPDQPDEDPDEDLPDDDDPDLNDLDTDGDGISDGGEIDLTGSDPNNPDTDGDGLTDGQEFFSEFFPTDPTLFDTDGDGLGDNDELNNAAGPLNPLDPDCDKDGLLDGAEVNSTGTPPCNADVDQDGLNDLQETGGVPPFPNTDPFVFDTDGDGFGDGVEVSAGTNPQVSRRSSVISAGIGNPERQIDISLAVECAYECAGRNERNHCWGRNRRLGCCVCIGDAWYCLHRN